MTNNNILDSKIDILDVQSVFPGAVESSLDDVPAFSRGNVGEGDYQGLPPGAYQVTLEKILKTERKKYQSNEMEPCLAFCFKEKKTGKVIQKRVSPSAHEKSNCRKLALQLCASQCDYVVFNDNLTFWRFLKSFEGKNFLAHLSISKDGKWNNIETIMPLTDL